jgi:hypothetical protein
MRADLHRLFDRGYITVTPDSRIEVSSRLKADYHNGKTYYPLVNSCEVRESRRSVRAVRSSSGTTRTCSSPDARARTAFYSALRASRTSTPAALRAGR